MKDYKSIKRSLKIFTFQNQDGETVFEGSQDGLIEVHLRDAVPEAFEMVLNYIYTDRIDPTRKSKEPMSNQIVLLMMDVYRLAVQVSCIS